MTTQGIDTEITTGTARAADGTLLGYRRVGSGRQPGLLVLHGAMSSGWHHIDLARALADGFSVVLLDRRGRGLTPETAVHEGLSTDVADLITLVEATGVRFVLGISSGAIITLEAARQAALIGRPLAEKLAIFEPPLFADAAHATRILDRFDRALDAGNLAAAATIGMQGAQLGPALLNRAPVWMVSPLVRLGLRIEARQEASEYVPMSQLIPLLHNDFEIVRDASGGDLARFGELRQPVVLIGAERSPAYLGAALTRLATVLPQPARVMVPGRHDVVWNTDRRGNPQVVADAIRRSLLSA